MIFAGKSTKSYNFYMSLLVKVTEDDHLKKYTYGNAIFTTTKNKMLVTCKEHGDFSVRVDALLQGVGCSKCSAKRIDDIFRKQTKTFLNDLGEVNYDTSNVVYVNAKSKVHLVCKEHGDFYKTPNRLLQENTPCSKCSKNTGFDKTKPAILYYLSINDGEAFKIGITNLTIPQRYRKVDLEKIEVIFTIPYVLGADAYAEEQNILSEFSWALWVKKPLLQNGNTEVFRYDVLNSDKGLNYEK